MRTSTDGGDQEPRAPFQDICDELAREKLDLEEQFSHFAPKAPPKRAVKRQTWTDP